MHEFPLIGKSDLIILQIKFTYCIDDSLILRAYNVLIVLYILMPKKKL